MKIFVFSDNVNIFKAKYKILDQLKDICLRDSFMQDSSIIDKLPIGAILCINNRHLFAALQRSA